jgi:ATP-dependent DNA helicase RecG
MNESFDILPSSDQDLSFRILNDTVWGRMRADYGSVTRIETDGKYNNLGLMLSDQCPWSTRICMDDGCAVILDGPVIKQYYDSLDILERLGTNRSGNKYAIEKYPRAIVREGLVNAFVHRDYEDECPVTIRASRSRLRIRSPGGVWAPDRPNSEDLGNIRNREMARLFRVLEGFSFQGNGITSIRLRYKTTPELPMASFDESSFTLDLPAITSITCSYEAKKKKIVSVISACRGASASTIADSTMFSVQYVRRILRHMEEENIVFSTGCGNKNIFYLRDPSGNGISKDGMVQTTLDEDALPPPCKSAGRLRGQKTV